MTFAYICVVSSMEAQALATLVNRGLKEGDDLEIYGDQSGTFGEMRLR